MNNVYKVSPVMLMLMVLAVTTGCAPVTLPVEGYEPTVDISALELDESASPHTLYKRPGTPDFDAYNRYIIDPVLIIYSDPKMQELSTEQVGKMQQYLRDAMIKELRDGGYEVGTRSEDGTMRMSFTIRGLKAPTALPNVTAAVVPFAASVGDVTVEWVLREALTHEIVAVVVTRSRGSRALNPTPWSTWADVEKTFDDWAKGLREAVDEAHGK